MNVFSNMFLDMFRQSRPVLYNMLFVVANMAGAAALAESLRFNETLKELDLSSNGIDDSGASAFADALSENKTLLMLNLAENCITSACLHAWAVSYLFMRVLFIVLQFAGFPCISAGYIYS